MSRLANCTTDRGIRQGSFFYASLLQLDKLIIKRVPGPDLTTKQHRHTDRQTHTHTHTKKTLPLIDNKRLCRQTTFTKSSSSHTRRNKERGIWMWAPAEPSQPLHAQFVPLPVWTGASDTQGTGQLQGQVLLRIQ